MAGSSSAAVCVGAVCDGGDEEVASGRGTTADGREGGCGREWEFEGCGCALQGGEGEEWNYGLLVFDFGVWVEEGRGTGKVYGEEDEAWIWAGCFDTESAQVDWIC